MSVDVSLKMKFKNELEKVKLMNINHCKENITDKEAKDLMDLIISSDVFETSGGALVEKVSSEIVKTTTTAFEII